MKQKRMALFLAICLLCTACTGEKQQRTEAETPENQQEEQQIQAEEGAVPDISYMDYSRELTDEETRTPVLRVEENCPAVTVKENEEAQNLINRVFEQQHAKNEIKIDSDFGTADSDFSSLEEEELAQWNSYRYCYMYETMYCSSKILSIKATQKEELGTEQPYQDVVAYTFYVPTGKLLTMSDIFADVSGAKIIAEQYIQEKVTSADYQKYLLEDYESYVSDILTEDDFYLNEEGLVVICNVSLLTEYEAGVIEITVPYEALRDVMNDVYLP